MSASGQKYILIPPPPLPEFYQHSTSEKHGSDYHSKKAPSCSALTGNYGKHHKPTSRNAQSEMSRRTHSRKDAVGDDAGAKPPVPAKAFVMLSERSPLILGDTSYEVVEGVGVERGSGSIRHDEVPPLAVYHICRICLRPRSAHYHRKHPIPINGMPPPPGICGRCRISRVHETGRPDEKLDISIHGESNAIKLGLSCFVPEDGRISKEEMKRRRGRRLLESTAATRKEEKSEKAKSNNAPSTQEGQPIMIEKGKKKYTYRHISLREDASPPSSPKGQADAQPIPTAVADWMHSTPDYGVDQTFDFAQSFDEASGLRASSSHLRPPGDRVKQSVSTHAPSVPGGSQELGKMRQSHPRPTSVMTNETMLGVDRDEVRRIAHEEVERYRRAERKLAAHPDPYAHGYMLPVEHKRAKSTKSNSSRGRHNAVVRDDIEIIYEDDETSHVNRVPTSVHGSKQGQQPSISEPRTEGIAEDDEHESIYPELPVASHTGASSHRSTKMNRTARSVQSASVRDQQSDQQSGHPKAMPQVQRAKAPRSDIDKTSYAAQQSQDGQRRTADDGTRISAYSNRVNTSTDKQRYEPVRGKADQHSEQHRSKRERAFDRRWAEIRELADIREESPRQNARGTASNHRGALNSYDTRTALQTDTARQDPANTEYVYVRRVIKPVWSTGAAQPEFEYSNQEEYVYRGRKAQRDQGCGQDRANIQRAKMGAGDDDDHESHVHFANKVDISPTPPRSEAHSFEFRTTSRGGSKGKLKDSEEQDRESTARYEIQKRGRGAARPQSYRRYRQGTHDGTDELRSLSTALSESPSRERLNERFSKTASTYAGSSRAPDRVHDESGW